MKQLNTLKTKRRGIFLALLLLMAMPMAAQRAGTQFQDGDLFYKVLDETKHTVMVIPERSYSQDTDSVKNKEPGYFGKLSGVIDLRQPVSYNGKNWTVTEVGERAFQLEKITEVKLPDGMTRIGNNAFFKTASLTKINFPSSLKAIELEAFYESGLTEVDIPGSTAIGHDAFFSCVNMEKLSIPNVTYMGYRCFFHCSKLNSVTVPKSAKLGNSPDESLKNYKLAMINYEASGHHAFADCYNLKKATILDGATTVTDGMFEYCGELVELTIPASVKSIGHLAFRYCFNLSSIDIKEVESIGKEAFWLCNNLKGDLVLSSKVKNIGEGAFSQTRFTGVKWEGTDGCKIDGCAFANCYFLEYLDLHTLQSPTLKTKELDRHGYDTKNNFANGLLSRTIVYLPQGVDFTFAEGEDVNFVKNDGSGNFTCTKLSVQDGADYEFPIPFTAKEAVYNKWEVDKEIGPGLIGNNIKEYPDRHSYYVYDYNIYEEDYEDGHIMPLASYRDFSGIKDGKNCFTMLLPYAVNVPTGFRAYKLHYKGTYNKPVQGEYEYRDYYLFHSIPDGSTLEANKPYLLCITDGQEHTSADFVANNVQVAASGADKIDDSGNDVTTQPSTSALRNVNAGTLKPQGFADTKTGQSYNFMGGTERLNNHLAANLNTWLLNTDGIGIDVWRKVEWEEEFIPIPGTDMIVPPTTVTAAPFRAYIQPIDNTVPAKPFVILTDDEAAAIDSLEQGTPLTGEQGIYTLDGRYAGNDLKALPSGIYVIKGKKIAK